MKTHQLPNEQITALLKSATVGTLSTLGIDGYPYAVPVHFVHYDNKIYIHCLLMGQKIDNIKKSSNVCFEVFEMLGFSYKDNAKSACSVNTRYTSVIIKGTAKLLEDFEYKKMILYKIVKKYTPHFIIKPMPKNIINKTALIEIYINECTGKYYK